MNKYIFVLIFLIHSVSLGGQMSQMEHIQQVFYELRADNIHILDEFYAPNVRFEDPLGAHNGLEAVKGYYKKLYQNVTFIEFEYQNTISEESKHLLVWKMNLKAKGLNSGELVTVEGNSVIEFNDNNLVIYHRDYFDMGEFIYEQIPILRWIISKVKGRLKG